MSEWVRSYVRESVPLVFFQEDNQSIPEYKEGGGMDG